MVNLSFFISKTTEVLDGKARCAFSIQRFNLFVLHEEYKNTSVFIYSYLNVPPCTHIH